MSLTAYCSQSDVQAVLSAACVLSHSDDDGDGVADSGNMTAMIQHATNEYNRHVRSRYTVAELAPSGTAVDSVRLDTAILAAHMLCRRRNNPVPDQLQEWYDDVIRFLKDAGSPTKATIIPGVVGACSKSLAPSTRNYGIDLRHRSAIVRVQKTISAEPPDRQPEHVAETSVVNTLE